jgi:CBS domain-containing protein
MANVTSVMTANPASCTAETPLREVARLMIENDCGQIPWSTKGGKLVGVVTDRDITVRIVAEGHDTMTRPRRTR